MLTGRPYHEANCIEAKVVQTLLGCMSLAAVRGCLNFLSCQLVQRVGPLCAKGSVWPLLPGHIAAQESEEIVHHRGRGTRLDSISAYRKFMRDPAAEHSLAKWAFDKMRSTRSAEKMPELLQLALGFGMHIQIQAQQVSSSHEGGLRLQSCPQQL